MIGPICGGMLSFAAVVILGQLFPDMHCVLRILVATAIGAPLGFLIGVAAKENNPC